MGAAAAPRILLGPPPPGPPSPLLSPPPIQRETDLRPPGEKVPGRVRRRRRRRLGLSPHARGTLTIHLGGGRRVVPVGGPAIWLEAAALPARALQHVHNLAAVDVPQGSVQVLHCGQSGWRGRSRAATQAPRGSECVCVCVRAALSVCVCVCVCEVTQSCPTLCDPIDCSPPGSSVSMGFSRQEYWSRLPFPSPGDLPNPGSNRVSCIAGRQFNL